MMLDMFSSLDFQFSKFVLFFWLVWVMGFLWVVLFLVNFFFLKKIFLSCFKMMGNLYYSNLDSPLNYNFIFIIQYMSAFSVFILFINFWSLLPYVYGLSTNLVLGLSLGFVYWVCLNLSNLFYKFKSFLSHFVSPGSPLLLGFSLSYMDVISSIVRPFTLTLRLVINVSMGHVIFSLMGLVGANLLFSYFFSSLALMVFLLLFFFIEIFVSMIQSLVFGLLSVNYLGEHS